MNLISRLLEHNPKVMSVLKEAFEATTTALERIVGSNAERIFRAPAATWALASVPIAALTKIVEALPLNLPDDLRADLAEAIRAHGPKFLEQVRDEAKRMMERGLSEPGDLVYLRYLYEAELAFPNISAFVLGKLVERASEPARIKNVLSNIRPPVESPESLPEEHARAVAKWSGTVVQTVFYPFAVDPLVMVESIVREKKLFKNKEGSALNQFNRSVDSLGACPPLPEALALVRNATAHFSIDVTEDGAVTLSDEDKADRVLSASELRAEGAKALADTFHFLTALIAVVMWRMSQEVASGDLAERFAKALANDAEFDFGLASDTVALEARLRELGVLVD